MQKQAAPMAAKQQPGHGNGDGGYDAEEALESLYGGYNLPDSSSASAATTHVPGYNEGDGSEVGFVLSGSVLAW